MSVEDLFSQYRRRKWDDQSSSWIPQEQDPGGQIIDKYGFIEKNSIDVAQLRAGAVTAGKLSVGYSAQGNLIPDSGWEWYAAGDTSRWTLGTGWALSAGAVGATYQFGRQRLRCAAPSATTASATSDFITVSVKSVYSLAVLHALESWTAGSGQILIAQYNSSQVLQTTSTLATFSATHAYPEVSAYVIAGNSATLSAGTTADLTLDASIAYIKITYKANALSASNWYIVGQALTHGEVPLLAATQAAVGGGVSIDQGGIIIYDGKLIFKDSYGATALTGEGFGPAWEDLIALGFYNGTFRRGDATTDTPNHWTVTQGTFPFEWSAGRMRVTLTGSGGSSSSSVLKSILTPVSPGALYSAAVGCDWSGGGSQRPAVNLKFEWYDSAGVYIADSSSITYDYDGPYGLTGPEAFIVLDEASPYATVAYVKLVITVSNGAGGSGTDYVDIWFAALDRHPISLQNDQYQTYNLTVDSQLSAGWIVTPLLAVTNSGQTALELSSTGSNTGLTIGSDTNLYRSAANTLKTDDALEVAGVLTNAGHGIVREWDISRVANSAFTSATATTIVVGPITSQNVTDTFRITLSGVISFRSNSPADTLTLDFTDNAGTSLAAVTITPPVSTAITNKPFRLAIEWRLATRSATVGNARGILALSEGVTGNSDSAVTTHLKSFSTGNTIDSTAFDVKMNYSTANASNTMTVRMGTFEHIVG